MDNVTEMLEPVHNIVRELLEIEKKGKNVPVYTDSDVIATALLFAHVMGNRLSDKLIDERVSIGMSKHLASTYGDSIALLTKQMSSVDLNSYKGILK